VPQPTSPSTAYVPALDGVRALAVLAVLGYHAAVPGLEGGLLGVGVFLTLSGFLITSILLSGWERRGTFDLRTFWVHRARRLLPALGVLLATVLAVTAVVDPGALSRRWDETLAAALYVSNWTAIADGLSYAAVLGGPEPLEHLWSLAVEEQFYLVWPILLLVLLRWFRGDRGAAALATGVLALASFVWMAVLASPGLDNTRAYEGTDTRAGELLVGAALALLLGPLGRRRRPGVPGRLGLDAGGLLALGVLGWLVVSTDFWSIGLYRGGFLLLALATAVLLAAVTTPGSVLGALLGIRPLRWVGERSYGIYLWHMPVIAFSPPAQAGGPAWVHTAYYLLATFALASFSWAVVEDPVRRHGLVGALRRLQPQPVLRGRLAPPVLVGGLAVVLGGSAVMATSAAVSGDRGGPGGTADGSLVLAAPVPDGEDAAAGAGLGRAGTARTSCTSVVHVGDSTSLGLVRPAYTPRGRGPGPGTGSRRSTGGWGSRTCART
jgi:peptidoglycan/LPS O-acetylase OafA/YrhL